MMRRKIKQILTVTLAALVALVFFVANTYPNQENHFDGPTQTLSFKVDVGNNEDDLKVQNEVDNTIQPRAALVETSVSRSGNTKSCTLTLHWNGVSRYNGWRFKQVTVHNASSGNNYKEYGSIGNGRTYKTYNVDSASTGSVLLGNMDIPTSVTEVWVDFDDIQGSLSANTDWLSIIDIPRKVIINEHPV